MRWLVTGSRCKSVKDMAWRGVHCCGLRGRQSAAATFPRGRAPGPRFSEGCRGRDSGRRGKSGVYKIACCRGECFLLAGERGLVIEMRGAVTVWWL